MISFRREVKKNKFCFFIIKKFIDKDYREAYTDFKKGNYSKSKDEIIREIKLVEAYWKCDPMHYYRYRLFEKKISRTELLDYIPPYYFYNIYMPEIYKGINISLYESKIFLNDLFIKRNIKTPNVIVIIKQACIFNIANETLSFDELSGELLNSSANRFFLKPDTGKGGEGIIVIEKESNRLYVDNVVFTELYFKIIISRRNYILQEGLIQRADISEINGTSVNTLRIITQYNGYVSAVVAVVMRIGRNDSFVDNSAQGGISVEVEIETGMLCEFAFVEHGLESFDYHPDSCFVFKGYRIKDWNIIKGKILDYACEITELKEIAWDIAIAEDDIYVIELNVNYGIDHLQCTCGGLRSKLNICK